MTRDEKDFAALFEKAEGQPEYWQQDTTLDFAEELCRLMDEAGVSRADLARRIGKSAAYVTQVLRADSNFTIGTMTKLGMAMDHRVRVHLAPRHSVTYWKDSLYFPEDSALRSDYTATPGESHEAQEVLPDETRILAA